MKVIPCIMVYKEMAVKIDGWKLIQAVQTAAQAKEIP